MEGEWNPRFNGRVTVQVEMGKVRAREGQMVVMGINEEGRGGK